MSAYGSYGECRNGVCLCPKCANRRVTCSPCMDCDGEDDTIIARHIGDVSNGYAKVCVDYKKSEEQ